MVQGSGSGLSKRSHQFTDMGKTRNGTYLGQKKTCHSEADSKFKMPLRSIQVEEFLGKLDVFVFSSWETWWLEINHC